MRGHGNTSSLTMLYLDHSLVEEQIIVCLNDIKAMLPRAMQAG